MTSLRRTVYESQCVAQHLTVVTTRAGAPRTTRAESAALSAISVCAASQSRRTNTGPSVSGLAYFAETRGDDSAAAESSDSCGSR